MANLSDKLGQTVVTSTPQSKAPITSVQQVLEDASAWPVIDGVKQQGSNAYCDGSTLDNSNGDYDDYLAASGSLTLPNGPFRTRTIDLTVTNTTFPNQQGINGYAYSDNAGDWWLSGSINLQNAVNQTISNTSVVIDGVVFDGTYNQTVDVSILNASGNGLNNIVEISRAVGNSGGIFIGFTGSFAVNRILLTFNLKLTSKPTWADANLESYPVVSLFGNNANVISTKNLNVSGDLTVSGIINGSIAGVGTVVENTDNTSYAISNANTWNTVRTITLTEGTWLVNCAATFSAGGSSTYICNLSIGDEIDTEHTQSIRLLQLSSNVGPLNNNDAVSTFSHVTVSKGETLDVYMRVRASVSGVITVLSDSVTGGLSDPDNSQTLFAIRIA